MNSLKPACDVTDDNTSNVKNIFFIVLITTIVENYNIFL